MKEFKHKDETSRAQMYLAGKRLSAIMSLASESGNYDIDFIRTQIKQEIAKYIEDCVGNRGKLKASPKIKGNACRLISNFKNDVFKNRVWRYVPYYLSQKDYDLAQSVIKNPIAIKRYDAFSKLHLFKNQYEFEDSRLKHLSRGDIVKRDVKLYLSQDEDMLFSKTARLKIVPKDLSAIKVTQTNKTDDVKAKQINDWSLYQRSFSIAIHTYLEGNVEKGATIFRYDNDEFVHSNVWLEGDARKSVFGDYAENPHFHFMNEDDALLCLANKGSKASKFLPGRCNAIDCRHLREYLKKLDSLSNAEAEKQLEENKAYGMPFLGMKVHKHKININIENIINNYIEKNAITNLSDLQAWVAELGNKPENNAKGKIFSSLIKALECLERITSLIKSEFDYDRIKMFSDLEILIANEIVEKINYIDNSIAINKYGLVDLGLEKR